MVEVPDRDIERLEGKLDQVIVMMAGDPLVTDPEDPAHTEKSVMGRLRAGDRRMDTMERKQVEAVSKLAEAIEAMQKDKFGWDRVIEWLKENGRWWKVGGAALFGLYFLSKEGIIPF